MPGEPLTTAELAKRLGLSGRTIQRYRRSGALEPELVTPGGHARWDEKKVREQLRALARREASWERFHEVHRDREAGD